MNSVFDIINVPLGYIFKWIYYIVGNYGWTIILFTLITKLILFPLTLKQQKSMKKTQALQPKLQKLQEKYQYDKEKLSQETMKLYQESGVNPMGGCLPTLIQFPILIALYNIIRKPLSYVLMYSNAKILELFQQTGGAADMTQAQNAQISLASSQNLLNFDFFGLNLSVTPTLQFISQNPIYALIPLIAGGTTYLVSYISNKMNGAQMNQDNNPTASSMKMMTYLFPLMTAWFAITLPAGLGLYWIISNLFQIVQMCLLNSRITVDMPVEEGPKHYRERKKKKK